MGRALVIKGANFESNRVARVVFSGVPCTAVSFNEDSYNVSSMTSGLALGITKTPTDTTDEAVFTVADTTVARVENGMLYAVGFGTTTVTVTCGSATDTVTVIVSAIEMVIPRMAGKRVAQYTTFEGDDKPLSIETNASYDAYVAQKTTGPTVPDTILKEDSKYAIIKIPSGTNGVTFEFNTTAWFGNMRFATTDSSIEDFGIHYAKYISNLQVAAASSSKTAVVNANSIPNGANGFAFEKATNDNDTELKLTFTPAQV